MTLWTQIKAFFDIRMTKRGPCLIDNIAAVKDEIVEIRSLFKDMQEDLRALFVQSSRISAKCDFRGLATLDEERIERSHWRSAEEAGAVQATWDARRLARTTLITVAPAKARRF